MEEIILDRRIQMLSEKLDALKRQSAALFNRKEEMLTYEKPMLQSLYAKLVGELQYEEYALQTRISQLSMRIDLTQAYINRNERIDEDAVERRIQAAFEEYNRTIEAHMEAVKAANEYLSAPLMSPEHQKELTASYRLIAKKLHPDINPDATEEQKDLFIKAVAAYKSDDLDTLRSIVLMLDTNVFHDLPAETLESQIEKVSETVGNFQRRIDEIMKTFPFTFQKRLYDSSWVESEQAKIKASIEALKKTKAEKEQYLAALKLWRPVSLS